LTPALIPKCTPSLAELLADCAFTLSAAVINKTVEAIQILFIVFIFCLKSDSENDMPNNVLQQIQACIAVS